MDVIGYSPVLLAVAGVAPIAVLRAVALPLNSPNALRSAGYCRFGISDRNQRVVRLLEIFARLFRIGAPQTFEHENQRLCLCEPFGVGVFAHAPHTRITASSRMTLRRCSFSCIKPALSAAWTAWIGLVPSGVGVPTF
jgi:hypothetical protein